MHTSETADGEFASILSSPEPRASAPARPISSKVKEALNSLYMCCLLESLAFGLVLPVQSLFMITDLGLSSWQVGLTLAVYYLAHMVGAFVSGRISDATGRRPILMFAFFWHGLAHLFVAVLASASLSGTLGHVKIGLVIAQQFFSGISGGSSLPAQTYVMDICSARTRSQPLSTIGAIYGGTIAVGALFGGFLVKTLLVSRFAVFLTGASLCFLASGTAFATLPESLPMSRRRLPSLSVAGLTADLSEVNLGMWSMWVARFGLSWAIYGLIAVYPFFVRANFGEDDIDFKLGMFMFIGAASQMVSLLLGFSTISRLLGKHFTLIVSATISGVVLALLPLYTKHTRGKDAVYYHVLWKIFFNGSIAIADAALPDALGLYVGERYLGFAQGMLGIFKSTSAIVGALVTGVLYGNSDSPGSAFIVMAGCCGGAAVMGALAKWLARRDRETIGKMKKHDDDEESHLDTVDTDTTRL